MLAFSALAAHRAAEADPGAVTPGGELTAALEAHVAGASKKQKAHLAEIGAVIA